MRLYLVRHLPPLVAPGVCYGRTDLPTDPLAQIHALPALRAALPATAPLYSSPLQRCAVLAQALGVPVTDARLAELDFGTWEMQRWDDIPRMEIDAWAADVAGYRPGSGDSVADMAARVDAFYRDLPVQDAIIVCHAGTIRLLTARAAGMDVQQMAQAAAAQPHRIGYGEIVIVDCV